MKQIFKHQLWHFLILTILLVGLNFIISNDDSFLLGELESIKTYNWILLAIVAPVAHQIYVLLCWRLELYSNSITNKFGPKGFVLFQIVFTLLFFSRLLTICLLAVSNAGTLNVDKYLSWIAVGILILPTVYLFYSVRKYFGFDRAIGIDHFEPEKYRNVPFVKKGIFRFSPNAMYVFGFFILWIPGLLLQSKAALLVAAFNHIYIWVHYYFTELPDMRFIYSDNN